MPRDRETGFECHHDDAPEIQAFSGLQRPARPRSFALGFRFVGDVAELMAAWMAATAYAAATAGVVFDPQEGRGFTPDEADEVVRRLERDATRVAALKEIERRLRSRQ